MVDTGPMSRVPLYYKARKMKPGLDQKRVKRHQIFITNRTTTSFCNMVSSVPGCG